MGGLIALGQLKQPTRLLIAALGGEGGGVLAGWITEAAVASGLMVSRTSIPGVAQRTGATTYYIEMVAGGAGQPQPILALNPSPGLVDVLLASELLEATRLAGVGMIAADRTTLIANTQRVYTMDEKMARADGRVDSARLIAVLRQSAQRALIADLGAVATRAKAPLSAVLLGALAAARVVPITDDAFRDAIRREGKSVDQNLAGFAAGLAAIAAAGMGQTSAPTDAGEIGGPSSSATRPEPIPKRDVTVARVDFPPKTEAVATLAVARLVDYQNRGYADTYLGYLRRFAQIGGVDDALLATFARHLAVRMTVEDVIRVAQLKLRQSRIARVTAEAKARPGDIVDITEFMKPGVDEVFGLLPPPVAKPLLRVVDRFGWSKAAIPMTVTTTRLSGFLRLRMLAGLRAWRPFTLRFHQEQAWLKRWLAQVEAVARLDPAAASEAVVLAKLVRGYSDTYRRGLAAWDQIAAAVIDPVVAAGTPPRDWADRILQARLAAEKDPEGVALTATLAAIGRLQTADVAGTRAPRASEAATTA